VTKPVLVAEITWVHNCKDCTM